MDRAALAAWHERGRAVASSNPPRSMIPRLITAACSHCLGTHLRTLLMSCALLFLSSSLAQAVDLITSAQAVRHLSAEQADRALPVRIKGVVLHYNEKVWGELTI